MVLSKSIRLFLILTYTFGGSLSLQAENKEQILQEFRAEVETWGDGTGYPLDEDIKELVIALNVSGIVTYQSCEGHLDRALPYPWVIFIYNADIEIIRKELRKLEIEKVSGWDKWLEKYPRGRERENASPQEYEALLDITDKYFEMERRLQIASADIVKPLQDALEEFYRNHSPIYDRMIKINKLDVICPFYEIICVGSPFQVARTEDEQAQKLNEYRAEMKAFAKFLIARYLNGA